MFVQTISICSTIKKKWLENLLPQFKNLWVSFINLFPHFNLDLTKGNNFVQHGHDLNEELSIKGHDILFFPPYHMQDSFVLYQLREIIPQRISSIAFIKIHLTCQKSAVQLNNKGFTNESTKCVL